MMGSEFGAWFETLPDDYFTTMKQFTKSFYRDEYPAINPEQLHLSQKDKFIVITGASSRVY